MPVKVVGETLPRRLRLIEVRPTVDLSFGTNRFNLTLDTGAGTTNFRPSVVKMLRLAPVGQPGAAYAGLDCPVVVNHYTMGRRDARKGGQLPSRRSAATSFPRARSGGSVPGP